MTALSFSSSASFSSESTSTAGGPVFFLIQFTMPSLHVSRGRTTPVERHHAQTMQCQMEKLVGNRSYSSPFRHSRLAGAVVVGGQLAINEPLQGGVALNAKLLAQGALNGGIDLPFALHRNRT